MSRPNVLLIICHDLGRHLGCCGVETVNSPNVDRLASEGVRFANTFCTAPQCSPSRAAIMTGRYPHANGMMGLAHRPFNWTMHPAERHVARIMSESGYRTALCGSQHVTQHPETLGFEDVFPSNADAVGNSQLFARWLDSRKGDERPFYVQLGFFEPHRPFNRVPPDDSRGVWVPPFLVDSEETRRDLAAYQGSIRRMDEAVGVAMETLKQQGVAENTLVIFTTDHGMPFPRAKCTLYDPGISTALILRWQAGGVKAGDVRGELLSNVDLLPMLLELVGVALPANLHGRSFAALLRGAQFQPRDAVFAEKTFHTYYDPMRAIRTERWKYIVNFEEGHRIEAPTDILVSGSYLAMIPTLAEHRPHFELYDLVKDPNEKTNLAGNTETANTERDLRRRLYDELKKTGDPLLEGRVVSPTYGSVMRALKGD